MFDNDKQQASLRKLYKKTLWAHIGISAMALAAAILLSYSPVSSSEQMIPWLIAAGVGLVLAAAEYAVERALLKKGKRVGLLAVGIMLAAMILCIILAESGVYEGSAALILPLFFSFMFTQSLIPAVALLRDYSRLNDNDPCETVGRIKEGSRRKDAEVGRSSYLLFEDELTHEVHLLRMGSVSPLHRYRVFYLPHSGLAVGEPIPDNITFDPFGNPVEREADEAEPTHETPDYTEEGYAAKPDYTEEGYAAKPDYTEEGYAAKSDYTEEEPAEKPWYQNPESFSADPPKAEPREADIQPAPNSPERQKAAKFGVGSKVCKILTFVFIGVLFLGGIATQSPAIIFPSFLFIIPSILLSEVFKSKELKLRCTRRTTAFCIDTVRRRSGKSSTRHPIVEYEVKGVTHTAELSISCSRDAVGDLYTICYDPLDPDTVRVERRGLFE